MQMSNSKAKLLFQGHGSFRLTTGDNKVIYVDPYAGTGYDLPADLILVTHQHYDHNCIDKPAKKDNCRVIQNTDALIGGTYKNFELPALGVKIEAVQAYNAKHNRDECVGYLVMIANANLLLYFSGDTSMTEQMRDQTLAVREIDYAFLPMDGIYNMDIPEAIECAKLIKARYTVPVHMIPGELFDLERAKKFADGLGASALIVEAGKEIALP